MLFELGVAEAKEVGELAHVSLSNVELEQNLLLSTAGEIGGKSRIFMGRIEKSYFVR
jgi:hypothetical protein